jgi:hypothetical protein
MRKKRRSLMPRKLIKFWFVIPNISDLTPSLSLNISDLTPSLYLSFISSVQPQNGDLRNLLLIIAPSKWNDSLRTAPPVASATVLNQDEEDRILNANAGNKSRIKKKEERTGGTEEEDEWLFHRKPVKKVCTFLTLILSLTSS